MRTASLGLVDPEKDTARYDPEVHYRLYDSERHGPTVVCVQDFDYVDYDGTRFLSYEKYATQQEAEMALMCLGVLFALLADRFRQNDLIP